jgi:hypothetical protein
MARKLENYSLEVKMDGINTAKNISTLSGTAVAAAAAGTPAGITMYSDSIKILAGTGSPNTVITAAKGSLFIRTDGSSTSTRLYVNTDGATAWTNFTSAA